MAEPKDEWAVLYTRMRLPLYDRIRSAAIADDRSVAKWVEIHFRDFFEAKDREPCEPPSQGTDSPSSG